ETNRLWVDTSGGSEDLLVSTDAGSGFQSFATVGFCTAGVNESEPFMDGTTLYYTADDARIHAARLTGSDPAAAASWTEPVTQLRMTPSPSPAVGDIISIGEASIGRPESDEWLYFVVVTRTPTGLDSDIARVRKR